MKTILLLLIFSFSIFPQTSSSGIQQITNVAGDARNVSIELNTGFDSNPIIFFEVHKDSISNVASINCDLKADKFSNPVLITNDSCLDINPKAVQFNNLGHTEDILFFQTNKLGNWRLAYKIRKDTVWSETKFVDSSSVDETNPTLFDFDPGNFSDSLLPSILYEKDNSIYIALYRDSSFNISEVFKGSDSISYSQPAGVLPLLYSPSQENNFYVSAKKVVNNEISLVYTSKTDTATQWNKEKIAVENGRCSNPDFYNIYGLTLIFENYLGRYSNIYFLTNVASRGQPTVSDSLLDSLRGNVSDLQVAPWTSYITVVVPKQAKNNTFSSSSPYAYKYLIDDSTFININTSSAPSVYFPDTSVYTKVKSTSLAISDFYDAYGNLSNQMIFTVWEDSVNGHIQLFSNTYTIITGIEDGATPASFQLYQNYPNPFNPSTKIKFYLAHNGLVKLTIYNILGQKIKELINGYMYSGNHEINFNADALGLASGVYLYQLKAGNNVTAKKMILLK